MSSHISSSRVFGHLWSTPAVDGLFGDEGRFAAWLDILATLAEAQAALGLAPDVAAKEIRRFAREEVVDLDEVARLTRDANHSTLGFIRHLRSRLPDVAADHVYVGATVQDLTDTWTALVLRGVADLVDADLATLEDTLAATTRTHADTVMVGRTHGQPGLPITFGFKTAVWLDEVRRHRARLAEGRPRWERAQLGGGLGTLEYWGEDGPALLDEFSRRLGLGAPAAPWLTARDGIAEFTCWLAMVTATLAKIGNEVHDLQRPELGEVRESIPDGTVGSITMPHKRNPERSEHLVTLARLTRRCADLALEGMLAQHERDGRAWKTEWSFLPEACASAHVASGFAVALVAGLEVDRDRMRANVEGHGGYLASAEVLRQLSADHGKHRAHELVYAASMAGRADGLTLREALAAADVPGVAELEADGVLDPTRAVASAPAFARRVLDAS